MKIIHIQGYWNNDVMYQEQYLTKGHQALGHDVVVLTGRYEFSMAYNYEKRKKRIGGYKYNNIIIHRLFSIEIQKNALQLTFGNFKQFLKYKPNVIFFHDITPTLIFGVLYKLISPKTILSIDFHSDEKNSLNTKKGRVYHFFFKYFFKVFDRFFTNYFPVFPEALEFVKTYYNLSSNKVTLLPLPGDCSQLNIKDQFRDDFRKEYKIPGNSKIFLHTGQLPQEKKTELVLNLFLQEELKDHFLIIAGSASDNFKSTIEEYSKTNNKIIYMGWCNPATLENLLLSCDILIQPGSLSQIFISGICNGLVVILNNTKQGQDLTRDNNGVLINNQCPEDFLRGTKEVLKNFENFKNNTMIAAKRLDYRTVAKLSLNIK